MKPCMNAYDQDGELIQPRIPMNNDIAKDAAGIQRFNPSVLRAGVVEDALGQFVRYDDHQRATAADKERIAELGRRLAIEEECSGALKDAADDRDGYYQQLLEARAQLAEKTQECEGLRQVIAKRPYCRNCNFPSVSLGEVVIDLNTGELLAPDSARKESE